MDTQNGRQSAVSQDDSAPRAGGAESAGGRILRVKRGYNPNSSSMGSELTAFYALPKAMVALPVIFGTAAAVIAASFGRRRGSEKESPSDPDNRSDSTAGDHEQ